MSDVPSPQRAVTVTSTATLLCSADPTNRPVFIVVNSNETLYLGDATVTTTNGLPVLKHTAPLAGSLGPGLALYGIAETGKTIDVRIFSVPED
jgi:hypothetical protein